MIQEKNKLIQDYLLASSLHLSKKMFSHWPRRGSTFLQIHAMHWKKLELLWESGFDVSALVPAETFMLHAPTNICHSIDVHILRAKALDTIPFADKSFDYVALNLAPIHTESDSDAAVHTEKITPVSFPPLHAMLSEALRVSSKGVIVQCLNPFSMAGLQYKCLKKSLPPFLAQASWFAWRDVCNTLQTLTQNGTMYTSSILLGPVNTWKPVLTAEKINATIIRGAMGALMQVRLNHAEGLPLTSTPLRVGQALQRKKVGPLIGNAERLERNQCKHHPQDESHKNM